MLDTKPEVGDELFYLNEFITLVEWTDHRKKEAVFVNDEGIQDILTVEFENGKLNRLMSHYPTEEVEDDQTESE